MLKDRLLLEQYLEKQSDRFITDKDLCKAIYDYANETYMIPRGIVSDLVSRRMSMSEASEFILFILLDSINNVNSDKRSNTVEDFYTEQEINFYKKSKYKIEKIKFPLVFKVIQITEDQWVGQITIDTLMKLRRAQLINYNVNAQRTMQRIVKGNKETYKIALNQKAVGEIQEAFDKGTFIPNTITLNIPMETNFDFHYDADTCSLVIKSLEHFDISDGFHRYISACQQKDKNKDFDYPMEIRIVNWDEDKAKQFIYQEDLKTKMRKIDSNSMNMNKAANIVVTRLNENVRCNLKGLISRNEGIVHFSELAELVDYFFFKGVGKEKERTTTIKAVAELTENFNMLTEYNTEHLEHKMEYNTLLAAMFCFDYYKRNNLDKANMCEVIEEIAEKIKNSDNKKFKNRVPRKSLMNEIEKMIREV